MPKFYKAPVYKEEHIEEMEEGQMQFPYTNKYMVYDSIKRQYIPTEALLLKHGINLNESLIAIGKNSPNEIYNELEYISDQIYSFVAKNSGSSVETLKYLIAKGIKLGMSPFRFRVMFEEVLWKQARYYVSNDDPTKTTGLDTEQKQWINKGVLSTEDRNIDPKVKITLMSLGLCWTGSYDRQFASLVRRQDW